jgi:hypothetical protein
MATWVSAGARGAAASSPPGLPLLALPRAGRAGLCDCRDGEDRRCRRRPERPPSRRPHGRRCGRRARPRVPRAEPTRRGRARRRAPGGPEGGTRADRYEGPGTAAASPPGGTATAPPRAPAAGWSPHAIRAGRARRLAEGRPSTRGRAAKAHTRLRTLLPDRGRWVASEFTPRPGRVSTGRSPLARPAGQRDARPGTNGRELLHARASRWPAGGLPDRRVSPHARPGADVASQRCLRPTLLPARRPDPRPPAPAGGGLTTRPQGEPAWGAPVARGARYSPP